MTTVTVIKFSCFMHCVSVAGLIPVLDSFDLLQTNTFDDVLGFNSSYIPGYASFLFSFFLKRVGMGYCSASGRVDCNKNTLRHVICKIPCKYRVRHLVTIFPCELTYFIHAMHTAACIVTFGFTLQRQA